MELQPHQQRVVAELEELNEKITRLFHFLDGDSFEESVPDNSERARLKLQCSIMVAYSSVLEMRIAAF